MSTLEHLVGRKPLLILGVLIILAGIGFGAYSYVHLHKENAALAEKLMRSQAENADLYQELMTASSTISAYTAQLGDISATIGTLKKLTETDPELLKKYSKVYFLSENYVPKGLIDIDTRYTYNGKSLKFLSAGYPFLTSLIEAANVQGLHLFVQSSYRSFAEQSGLKSAYKVTYGKGTANTFSADQGYSEHQLGTTVDFTTEKLAGGLTGFDKTPEYAWLLANAYRYGFVLSYPAGNDYYIFEPWHWRFVGIALATRLHEERQSFYDLEQRQLDPYLIKLFDSGAL